MSADNGIARETAPAPQGTAAAPARREAAYALLACALGAGLVVLAASRAWSVEVTVRPAPLPAIRHVHTGDDLLPWLTPLALVGFAGAGALLATRGWLRRMVAAAVTAVGVAVAVGGGYGVRLAGGDGWPLLAGAGGVILAGAGVFALVRAGRWPGMGARYERGRRPPGAGTRRTGTGGQGPEFSQVWDALDRGEDPTGR